MLCSIYQKHKYLTVCNRLNVFREILNGDKKKPIKFYENNHNELLVIGWKKNQPIIITFFLLKLFTISRLMSGSLQYIEMKLNRKCSVAFSTGFTYKKVILIFSK